jgi:hypothetical protein
MSSRKTAGEEGESQSSRVNSSMSSSNISRTPANFLEINANVRGVCAPDSLCRRGILMTKANRSSITCYLLKRGR